MAAAARGANPFSAPSPVVNKWMAGDTKEGDVIIHRKHQVEVVRDKEGHKDKRENDIVEMATANAGGFDVVRMVHEDKERSNPAAQVAGPMGPGHRGCILDGYINERVSHGDPVARHRYLLEHSLARDMGCTGDFYSQYFGQHDAFNRLSDYRFFPVRHKERFDPATGQGLGILAEDFYDSVGRPISPAHHHRALHRKRPPAGVESAKCIWVFRNGDGHDIGTRYFLKTNQGRYTLKHICVELSGILKPTGGAIRELYDQKLDKITKVSELKDGGCYLACEGSGPTSNRLGGARGQLSSCQMFEIRAGEIERDMVRLLQKDPNAAGSSKHERKALYPAPPAHRGIAASINVVLKRHGLAGLLTERKRESETDEESCPAWPRGIFLEPEQSYCQLNLVTIEDVLLPRYRQSGRLPTDYHDFFDRLREEYEDCRDDAQRAVKEAYLALNLSYDAEWEKILERAKSLKHRYKAAGDRRRLARVYKAFSILEADRKKKLYGGDEQLIGRSRRDRELDGMFNHMSKEIAKRHREESVAGSSSGVDLMHTVVADDTVHTGELKKQEPSSASSSSSSSSSSSKKEEPPTKKAKEGSKKEEEPESEGKDEPHHTKMSEVDWPAQFARMREGMAKHEKYFLVCKLFLEKFNKFMREPTIERREILHCIDAVATAPYTKSMLKTFTFERDAPHSNDIYHCNSETLRENREVAQKLVKGVVLNQRYFTNIPDGVLEAPEGVLSIFDVWDFTVQKRNSLYSSDNFVFTKACKDLTALMLAKETKWRGLNQDPLASSEASPEESDDVDGEECIDGEGLEDDDIPDGLKSEATSEGDDDDDDEKEPKPNLLAITPSRGGWTQPNEETLERRLRAEFVRSIGAMVRASHRPGRSSDAKETMKQVYQHRDIFSKAQQESLLEYNMAIHQTQLSTQNDKAYRFEYRSILESKAPVRDSRETRISFDHQRGAFATPM
ncbi:hypothetical protein FOL47_000951 [Perkinsus chesapeaki]|uniref:Doublecortin domain-containing protein n=1 Tax=Perkinsus chesapeaki TaxID=330153 RepID=A0A7J6MKR7_PERCH|nr:hypothetical protein FOL47_000951 [Perkinsus chesapeaki]